MNKEDYIFIYIDFKSAEKLCEICKLYNELFDVDIIHGRHIVDGCSMLGIMSMGGNMVRVKPLTDNEEYINSFFKEVEKIGAYYIKGEEQ